MAYKIKYSTDFNNGTFWGYIHISELDYTGIVIPFTLKRDGLLLENLWKDWEQYIIGSTCSFDIINNDDNFFIFQDLMEAYDKQFKVTVLLEKTGDAFGSNKFAGFLNAELTEQKYLKYQILRLTASSYVSRLKYIIPEDMLNYTIPISFIDIISTLLNLINGEVADIYVDVYLKPKEDGGVGSSNIKTLFNLTGVNSEMYWKNEIERNNGDEILHSILSSFNCYLFVVGQDYYIISYHNLKEGGANYVKYSTSSTYGPTNDGISSPINIDSIDVHDLQFSEMSQLLQVNQGYKKVILNIEDKLFYNLIDPTFLDITGNGLIYNIPDIRKWHYFNGDGDLTIHYIDTPYKTILHSIRVYRHYSLFNKQPGLTTKFRMNINAESIINIKWKFTPLTAAATTGVKQVYNVYYYLRYFNEAGSKDLYYVYNRNGEWETESSNTKIVPNYIKIDKGDFDDDMIAYPSLSIPIGEIENETFTDYNEFVLCICAVMSKGVLGIEANYPNFIIGDVAVSTNLDSTENLLEGTTNQKYLEEIELNVDLADRPLNWGIKNGVLRGETLELRTTKWYTAHALPPLSNTMAENLLLTKIQLYYKVRYIIKGTVYVTDFFNFRTFLQDSKLFKDFILSSMSFNPLLNAYEIVLMEYDNSTDINIVV